MRYFYISEESRSHKHQRCSISTHSKCVGISFRLKFYLYSDVLSIRGTQTEHNGNLNKYCCTICGKSINAIHIYEENGAYGKAAAEGSIYNTTARSGRAQLANEQAIEVKPAQLCASVGVYSLCLLVCFAYLLDFLAWNRRGTTLLHVTMVYIKSAISRTMEIYGSQRHKMVRRTGTHTHIDMYAHSCLAFATHTQKKQDPYTYDRFTFDTKHKSLREKHPCICGTYNESM